MIIGISDIDLLFGLPLNMHAKILDSQLHVWKLFHAEILRTIWFSRCQKKSKNEIIHIQALKGIIVLK
jgi:hypothetical protein